jgi:hypothetical protein
MPKYYEEIGAEDDNLIHDQNVNSGLLSTTYGLSRASFFLGVFVAFLVLLVAVFTAGSYFTTLRNADNGECTGTVQYTPFTQLNYFPSSQQQQQQQHAKRDDESSHRQPQQQAHYASAGSGARAPNEFPVPVGAARFSVSPGSLLIQVWMLGMMLFHLILFYYHSLFSCVFDYFISFFVLSYYVNISIFLLIVRCCFVLTV